MEIFPKAGLVVEVADVVLAAAAERRKGLEWALELANGLDVAVEVVWMVDAAFSFVFPNGFEGFFIFLSLRKGFDFALVAAGSSVLTEERVLWKETLEFLELGD